MKNLALLLTWAFLASAGISNALASSAYTCATFSYGSAAFTGFGGINDKGQVLGAWSDSASGPLHAFLRNPDGSTTPLALPNGSDQFGTVGINNSGQILGVTGSDYFILNPDGSSKAIAPPVAPPGHTYDSRTNLFSGINDKGELAGSINADSNGASTIDLMYIRGTDGNFRIIDRVHSGSTSTAYAGAINNSEVVEHNETGLGEYLLLSNGSKVPLALLGLSQYAEPPATNTVALNNNNAAVGYTIDTGIPSNLFYTRSPDGHYRILDCPDEVNARLSFGGINDQNVVTGTATWFSPSGSETRQVGLIVTPSGVSPQVRLSDSNWTFGRHLLGTVSGPGKVFLSNTGTADLHIVAVYADQMNNPAGAGVTQSNCATQEYMKPTTIPPGGTCFVEFDASPQLPGWRTGTIYIANDAPDSPQTIHVGVTGIGSRLQLSNTSWTFAAHRVNDTSGKGVIYAYNPGPAPVSLQPTIEEQGAYPAVDFNLISETCSPGLQPHKACAVTFNFSPRNPGENKATLNLQDNSEHGPIQIPISGYAY